MFNDRIRNDSTLAIGAKLFRFLASLCKIAFLVFVLWNILVTILLCYGIVSSDLPPDILPIAWAIPFINALCAANTCMLPLIFGNMLGEISENRTPFTMKNSKRLLAIGFILVAYSVLEEVFVFFISQFDVSMLDSVIHLGNVVRDHLPGSGTALNMFPLIMAAMFFALSYVFKYGVLLQQESDETL